MDRTGLVPYSMINTALLPAQERRQAWTEFVSVWQLANPLGPDSTLASQSHSWMIGDLVVGWAAFSAQTMVRRRGREISDSGRRYLLCFEYLQGASQFVHGDQLVELKPGTVHLFDYERECSSIATDGYVNGVVIPYEAIGYDPAEHAPRFAFHTHTTAGKVLADTTNSMIKQAPAMRLSDAPRAAAFYCGMLAELIRAATPRSTRKPECLGHEIRTYVAKNVARNVARIAAPGGQAPELTVDALTKRFATSRATLYRHFKAYGGLKSFVEARRMDIALHHLTFGPKHRGRISEVAQTTGYKSVRQFSKVFSRHFGVKPSEVLGADPSRHPADKNSEFTNLMWQNWNKRAAYLSK